MAETHLAWVEALLAEAAEQHARLSTELPASSRRRFPSTPKA